MNVQQKLFCKKNSQEQKRKTKGLLLSEAGQKSPFFVRRIGI
jgi:hypothetical protein